jgi:hypothetical protein
LSIVDWRLIGDLLTIEPATSAWSKATRTIRNKSAIGNPQSTAQSAIRNRQSAIDSEASMC